MMIPENALSGVPRRVVQALDRRPALQPFNLSGDLPHLLLVVLPLWALYLATAPRTVVLEDDGLFVLSGYFLGIEHPPGYPLYVLLAKLATLIPVGSVAWRVHALSGLFGALACAYVWICARLLIPGYLPAYLAALGYGVSLTFWSQALIADVYSLHSLIFFVLLFLALRGSEAGAAARTASGGRPYLFALLLGLGASNHWPLLLLSTPGLAIVLWPCRREILARLPGSLAAFAAGLLPYVWMVWRSRMLPEISFSGPIEDWSEFLYFVGRSGYVDVDASTTAGWQDKLGFIGFLVREAAVQMTPVGFLLAIAGLWAQRALWPPTVRYGLLAAFLGPTLMLVLLLSFDDQWLQRLAFRVYPVVAWGVMALWAAVGLHWVRERLPASRGIPVAVLLVLLTTGLSLLLHRDANDRHADRFGHNYAQTVLGSLPPNAVLFLTGDAPTATIAYLNRVEGVRGDVTLMNENGLVLEPRLFDPVTTSIPDRARAVDDYVRRSERPVFFLHDRGGEGERTWLTFRPERDDGSPETPVFRLLPSERDFLVSIAGAGELSDGWSEFVRRSLLGRFATFATQAELAGQAGAQGGRGLSKELEMALGVPEAKLARAQVLASSDFEGHWEEIAGLLRGAAAQADSRMEKTTEAQMYLLAARVAASKGSADTARSALELSLSVWPHPENPARNLLDQMAPAAEGAR